MAPEHKRHGFQYDMNMGIMGNTRLAWVVFVVLCAACGSVRSPFIDGGDVDAATTDAGTGVDGAVACAERACSAVVDSCCPSACNAANDIDCAATCGNSVLEPGERCDPLSTCPSSCPAVGCSQFALDQPGTCFARCIASGTQTACVNSDGCCPGGCNANTDSDCSPACGNGTVENGETCDPLGSCPSSCPQTGCQLRTLQSPNTCQAVCVPAGTQTACTSGDGCCPSGCTIANDNDCMSGCGNGILEAGETCDPINTCPTSCRPDGCQLFALSNPGTCQAQCTDGGTQMSCINADGCCPSGCTSANDSDCAPVCGNGIVEAGETCDPLAPPGQNCVCGTEAFPCYTQTGTPGQCDVRCHQPVTACGINGDSCCAFDSIGGCSNQTDAECAGPRWDHVAWPNDVTYTAQCETVRIYGIDPNGSYVFTTCSPSGGLGTGDPKVETVIDSNGDTYGISNDDCADSTALPHLAGWSCTTSAGALRHFCVSPSPGGFRPRSANVFFFDVKICPYSAGSEGTSPFFIWFNANTTPNPG